MVSAKRGNRAIRKNDDYNIRHIFRKEKFAGYLSKKEVLQYLEDVATFFEDFISNTYGPYGSWKLIIDDRGELIVTRSGGLMLESLKYRAFKSPLARVFVSEGITFFKNNGDGVKSFLLLSCLLIKKGANLVRSGLAPHNVIEGYKVATQIALKYLEDLSKIVTSEAVRKMNLKTLIKNAIITSFWSELDHLKINDLINDLCEYLLKVHAEQRNSSVSEEDILIIKLPSGSSFDSKLLHGVVVKIPRSSLISVLDSLSKWKGREDIRVIVMKNPYDILRGDKDKYMTLKDIDIKKELVIKSPTDLVKYLKREKEIWHTYSNLLDGYNVDVILSRRKLNKKLVTSLQAKGIMCLEGIDERSLKSLAKLSGSNIISSIASLSKADIGIVKRIRHFTIHDKHYLLFESAKDVCLPITLLLKGPKFTLADSEHQVRRIRIIFNKLSAKNIMFLPAGGVTEILLASKLKDSVRMVPAKIQLPLLKYAEALEELVKIFSKNMGIDPLDVVTKMRSLNQQNNFDNHTAFYAVDPTTKEIKDISDYNLIEFYDLKRQVIETSMRFVEGLLRIDTIILHKQVMEEVRSEIGKRFVNV